MNNAKKRYKKKIDVLRVELYPTDEDIKEWVQSCVENGESKAGAVKRLIRADIEKRE